MTVTKADILLLAVNEHEDEQLRAKLTSQGYEPTEVQGDSRYHYDDFGEINGQRVFYAKSAMGSSWRGATEDTVRKAVEDINPSLVVCVGIAWGAKEDEQAIGDVLIATQVQIGANAKLTKNRVVFRGPRPDTSHEAATTLEKAANKLSIRQHKGPIISKEDLYDNKVQRDRAVRAVDGAIGGEMEAAGALKALADAIGNQDRNYELAVAKGICDWGYKKNSPGTKKEEDQKFAAQNAARVVVHAIENYRLVAKKDSRTGGGESLDSLIDLRRVLRFKENVNFQFQRETKVDNKAVAFWPVRLREPNIIHAAQAYAALQLESKGIKVHLCLDDLGNIDSSRRETDISAFKGAISSWGSRVKKTTEGQSIVDRIMMFSDLVPNPHDDTKPEIFGEIGRHLVKWLVYRDSLHEIFVDAKIADDNTDEIPRRKPRRLLTPAVVWSVMESKFGNNPSSPKVITIGGVDEQDLWAAYKVQGRLDIRGVLLPRVDGHMDTSFRPATAGKLAGAFERNPKMKKWGANFLVALPFYVSGDEAEAHKDWESETETKLAEMAFHFYG